MTEIDLTQTTTRTEYIGGFYRDSGEWKPFAGLSPRPELADAEADMKRRASFYGEGTTSTSVVARAYREGRIEVRRRTVVVTTSSWGAL